MHTPKPDIELITAASILGLKPSGVEHLAGRLLSTGLEAKLQLQHPVLHMPTMNAQYSGQRDTDTHCLNTDAIINFSQQLADIIASTVQLQRFALVLGGDCSILLGVMSGLKTLGSYGLVFLDAHADFYEPERSVSGEVADMDLAIVTGRGPEKLTNMNGLRPYVRDEHVIQVGQRDAAETAQYGSRDIRNTAIRVFDMATIEKNGMERVTADVTAEIRQWDTSGCWLHFDTDVLSDDINPAVDYRLPGGLHFEQVEHFIRQLLQTGKMAGMSVTIFNPLLDTDSTIAKKISATLVSAFS
ncbi:arginase family protein [uncultured Chitinophaga sp.]|jgi:Arginase/agmatinase/formimionoglutamate hydrolase, arginase family|uniref:arginase family protein n=1 Tax=uncultured Chitinophaga sp. TaxID=339340 RepID=UPI00262AB9D2|nr:arginase family protein [uncultured Chitinophaga sp.]